jgi:glycosyltransferase involved in cell wall biosynthesis
MPSFNSERFISDSLNSILEQTFADWEVIVSDDFSNDKTKYIVYPFIQKDDRIKLIESDRNCGPALARNKAIERAKGRYIAFLDSDDLWLPEKLEKQINFMTLNKSVLCFTAYGKIDEEGNVGKTIRAPKRINYKQLLRTCSIGILTAMYDSKQLGKQYMPDLFSVEDYGLWLRITRKGYEAHGINEKLAMYRVRKHGISRNKIKKAKYQWRVYRDLEKISFFKSLFYMGFYSYYGYKKFRL